MTWKERIAFYRKATGKIARFNIGFGLPYFIALLEPDVLTKVFNANTEAKNFFPYSGLVPFLGNSLLVAGGARWKRQRNLVKQAFGKKEIRSFFVTFRGLAKDLVAYWEKYLHDNGEGNDEGKKTVGVTVDDFFSKLTMEAILRCAFACKEPNWIEEPHTYGALFDSFFKLHMGRYKNPLNMSHTFFFTCTSNGKKMRSVCDKTLAYARDILEKRKQAKKERASAVGPDSESDLCMVDILLEARDPETGAGMSEEDLVYECNLFLLAGFDTSRLTLTWLFYLLASHPDHQQRARDEVDSVFDENDGELTADSLSSLSYVAMCIKETLRHYPPVTGELRILKDDIVLDGYTVPKGIVVAPSTLKLHFNPRYWERADDFYPEHFTPEREAKRPAGAFCPFSTGPRRCMGEVFAMEEMKTVTAYLLRNFDFVIDPSHPVEVDKVGFTLPSNGVRVFLKSRLE